MSSTRKAAGEESLSGRERSRKRARLPAFCDATASLLVSPFAAARLPELKALYQAKYPPTAAGETYEASYASSGCRTTSRHLRRRVTSFNPKHGKRHRYPCGGGKPTQSKSSSNQTTSAESDSQKQESPVRDKSETAKQSRKVRRGTARRLQSQHSLWKELPPALETSNSKAEDKDETMERTAHWVPTHLWHAKRFHMESLWGWMVPLLHTNRGAKAALRLAQQPGTCLVQDITWRMQPVISLAARDGQELQTLVQSLSRVVPEFSTVTPDTDTIETGKGMLYPPNSAPLGAIGPISWIITPADTPFSAAVEVENDCDKNGMELQDADNTAGKTIVHLFVHPDIQPESRACWECLPELQTCTRMNPKALAYLTLRGGGPQSAQACLSRALQKLQPTKKVLPGIQQAIDSPVVSIMDIPQQSESPDQPNRYGLTIIPVRPREENRHGCNWGVCGLDVVLHPDAASILWNELILLGGACPIGLTEEAQLSLECHPPLPLFPRDYPDTRAGQAYWSPTSNHDTVGWKMVRHYWEGGLGRISRMSEETKQATVDWNGITTLPENNNTNDSTNIAMIRGDFGKPILDLMCSTSPLEVIEESKIPIKSEEGIQDIKGSALTKKRRRRPPRNSTAMVRIPPAGGVLLSQFQSQCELLWESLTLPAVLLAHVRVEFDGFLWPGAALYDVSDTSVLLLGFVTANVFSPARGRCHGMAVVGAARFLQALSKSHKAQALTLARDLAVLDSRQTRLLAQVRQSPQHVWHQVSISLLLF